MTARLTARSVAGSPSTRGRRPAARAAGFSLIEVLAAFVILSLVATTLFELFGGALRNMAAADDWSRATLVAESRLADAASVRPLREISDRGEDDDGRIKWETRVTSWEPQDIDPELARVSQTMRTQLYRIEVEVTFPGLVGAERKFSLATVRLAERNPN